MRAQWGATSFMHNTHKVAKLRTNTLITGSTIMRASGNELSIFLRSSARASILVSKRKSSFVRMEFEGAMVGCARARKYLHCREWLGCFCALFVQSVGTGVREEDILYKSKNRKNNKHNTNSYAQRVITKRTNTHTNAFFSSSSSICRSSPRAALRFDPGSSNNNIATRTWTLLVKISA